MIVGAMVRVCFGTAEAGAVATGLPDKAAGRSDGALDGAGDCLLAGAKIGKRVGRSV